MLRSIPDGRALSSIVVALSATLAACGGGGSDPASSTTSATASVTDVAPSPPADVNVPTQDAAAAVAETASKDIIAPALDPDSASVVMASATETVQSVSAASVVTITSTTTPPPAPAPAPVAAPTPVAASAAAAHSGVGLNVTAMNYYSSEVATFDVMKRAGPWLTQCSGTPGCSNFAAGAGTWDTKEEAALDLDANGYPRTLPVADDTKAKFRKVTTMVSANGTLPAGRYTVVYDGVGTLAYGGNVTKQPSLSKAGREIIDVAGGPSASMYLTITSSTPGNYLRNIRIYLPGGACANDLQAYAADASACGGAKGAYVPFESFPKTAIWNPQFLADVKGFRTLRFMDWGNTNSNMMESWAQRPLVTDRVWSGPNGVPIEAMLDLSNTVNADPWMNLPAHVNDDYIAQFSRLAVQKLSPGLKVNLEYAN
jgi:hypothetical protein